MARQFFTLDYGHAFGCYYDTEFEAKANTSSRDHGKIRHLIEYSAVEALQAENNRLKDDLHVLTGENVRLRHSRTPSCDETHPNGDWIEAAAREISTLPHFPILREANAIIRKHAPDESTAVEVLRAENNRLKDDLHVLTGENMRLQGRLTYLERELSQASCGNVSLRAANQKLQAEVNSLCNCEGGDDACGECQQCLKGILENETDRRIKAEHKLTHRDDLAAALVEAAEVRGDSSGCGRFVCLLAASDGSGDLVVANEALRREVWNSKLIHHIGNTGIHTAASAIRAAMKPPTLDDVRAAAERDDLTEVRRLLGRMG